MNLTFSLVSFHLKSSNTLLNSILNKIITQYFYKENYAISYILNDKDFLIFELIQSHNFF